MGSRESWCSVPEYQPDQERVFQWVPEQPLGKVWMFWESLKDQGSLCLQEKLFWLFSCQIFSPTLGDPWHLFIPCSSRGLLLLFPKNCPGNCCFPTFEALSHPGCLCGGSWDSSITPCPVPVESDRSWMFQDDFSQQEKSPDGECTSQEKQEFPLGLL